LFTLFRTPMVVSKSTAENILACFDWFQTHFDRERFNNDTALVLPNGDYFPDKTGNEYDMTQALFKRITEYSGLATWPFHLVPPAQYVAATPPIYQLNTKVRNNSPVQMVETQFENDDNRPPLIVSYVPEMMKQPMALVASMSKAVAQHCLFQSQQTPPTGLESFNETAELMSIFMGFGVHVVNSAYNFRGGCAKCYDPRANRNASLPENEAVFALALFCHLKQIPNKAVTPSLKSYLRPMLKQARKQINALPLA